MKKIVMTLMVVLYLTALAGCNTMHGFGKDMKKLGEKIEESAE